jgi:hypothetical protein
METRAGQRHQIMRQVLEVGGCSGDTQQALSDLRAIYYRRLLPIIDMTCSALSTAGQVHRLDLLEIDLGMQSLDSFERSIAEAFEAAFARALADALATTEPETPDAELALIAYFMHTGMVPWWADRSDARLLDASLEALIARAPDALRDAIERATADAAVWRRIVRAFPDRLLDALMALLMPPGAVADRGAGTRWVALLTEVVRNAGRSPAAVRHIWWEEVLKAARTASTAVSGTPRWFAAIFWRVAQRLALDDGELVTGLQAAIDRVDAARRDDQAASPHMRLVAEALWRDARGRRAIATELKRSTMAGKTITRPQAPSIRSETDERVEAKAAARTPAGMNAGREAEPSPSVARQRRVQAALRFSDADETYVDNAGLVMLWPFLERFFARVGLVGDARRFVDEAARQRAVGLMQYLATEEADAPEFLVPLNKVLCGMPLDDVFDFGAPIADAEIEACGEVLTAAIQHAPILRDMSIAGFRSAFLRRDGQLSTRDGAWLLRVQRETHDIVLDRFPWSARVVKLPWMDTMVVVEW